MIIKNFNIIQNSYNIYSLNLSYDINNIINNYIIIDNRELPSTSELETIINFLKRNMFFKNKFKINTDVEIIFYGYNFKIDNLIFDLYYNRQILINILENFKNITIKKESIINIY